MKHIIDYVIILVLSAATIAVASLSNDRNLTSYCVIMLMGLIILAFSNMVQEWESRADKERIEFLRELLYKGKGEGDE